MESFLDEIHGLAHYPKKYLEDVFTGEGDKLWGVCWSLVGYPAAYCAEKLSLAIRGLIVHL